MLADASETGKSVLMLTRLRRVDSWWTPIAQHRAALPYR
jgi:hypothetical protein